MGFPDLEVLFMQPLAPFTTFGIGGSADVVYMPKKTEDLKRVVKINRAQGENPVFLGGGSNVLVSDEGVAEPVVILKRGFDRIEHEEPVSGKVLIRAGAGVSSAGLVSEAARRGWADLVFLAGIPGTIGGAAVMNAGYGDRAVADVITRLKVIEADGETIELGRKELNYSYRRLELNKGVVVVEVELGSRLEDPEKVGREVREARKKRRETQPKRVKSAGSFFKNPGDDFAGRLIEAAGLKGERVGQAQVSPVHANFIVNTGSATALEVMTLAQKVRDEVMARFNVQLRPEVRFIGRGGERWPWMGS